MATIRPSEVPSGERPRVAPRSRRRGTPKLWPWLLGFVILALVGYYFYHRAQAGKGGAQLITAPVTTGNLQETISATGSVAAQTGAEVHIGSQITGVIKRLYADVGRYVRKGDLIAELDLPDLAANLRSAQDAYAAAQVKYQQQLSGIGQTRVQTASSIEQNRASVNSAQQKLSSAEAAYQQQANQTPSDIRKAQTSLSSAKAALSTSKATLVQTQAGANLNVANAKEALQQAQANAANSSANLQRLTALLAKGYESQADVDAATASNKVNQSLVASAQQNVQLTQQKVTADLQTAQDAVAQAQEGVNAAQAALDAANAEKYSTAARLADVKDSQAAVRQAQANLNSAIANGVNNTLKAQDVKQALAAMEQAQAQVAFSQAQYNKSFIRTPISGTVLQLASQQGETLAAGLSAPTLIIVADLNRLEIDSFVDESDIGKVRLGQLATCVVDAFPDQTFTGKVVKIASGSTIQSNVVTYAVTIAISDPHHELKPDMTASITIVTGQRTGVLLVPSVAVNIGSQGSTVNVVKTVNGKQETQAVPVVTGGTDGVNTEIVSGLKKGDIVVLAGMEAGRGRGFGPQNPFGPSNQQRQPNRQAVPQGGTRGAAGGGGNRGGGGGSRGG